MSDANHNLANATSYAGSFDRILYPLAERRLSKPVKQELARRFLATLLFENLALPIEVTWVRRWGVPG
ncbi:MAG: hypothetical protein AMJ62_08890 [Myxococcales bacterium SG8_38]|nr:MAG: hypothetical protein AMJ62_08890 [Myxococcales bacterium SG8_38]